MAYTAVDDASAHFQIALWTGTQSSNARTNDGNSDLQPDFLWGKEREGGGPWVYDSSRGLPLQLSPDATYTESTQSTMVTSFNSDGFTLGTDTGGNETGQTYVGWQWKANGGTRTTNTESGNNPAGGYQVNTTAGFSIVDYTGTGAAGTMAHGLGAVPDLIIIKNRDVNDAWAVYHSGNTGAPETDYLVLNTYAATADDATYWNDTAPTSSVFTVATAHNVNADAEKYIAYIWTEIQGYSKFGSYTGNGNADGTFVYTGFKPSLVIIKNTAGDEKGWFMVDTTRETFNPIGNAYVFADTTAAEVTDNSKDIDILSNGFKLRLATGFHNDNDVVYIYMAFAEQPFVTSGGVPATAF